MVRYIVERERVRETERKIERESNQQKLPLEWNLFIAIRL